MELLVLYAQLVLASYYWLVGMLLILARAFFRDTAHSLVSYVRSSCWMDDYEHLGLSIIAYIKRPDFIRVNTYACHHTCMLVRFLLVMISSLVAIWSLILVRSFIKVLLCQCVIAHIVKAGFYSC